MWTIPLWIAIEEVWLGQLILIGLIGWQKVKRLNAEVIWSVASVSTIQNINFLPQTWFELMLKAWDKVGIELDIGV